VANVSALLGTQGPGGVPNRAEICNRGTAKKVRALATVSPGVGRAPKARHGHSALVKGGLRLVRAVCAGQKLPSGRTATAAETAGKSSQPAVRLNTPPARASRPTCSRSPHLVICDPVKSGLEVVDPAEVGRQCLAIIVRGGFGALLPLPNQDAVFSPLTFSCEQPPATVPRWTRQLGPVTPTWSAPSPCSCRTRW
jgi:hypothetical protein